MSLTSPSSSASSPAAAALLMPRQLRERGTAAAADAPTPASPASPVLLPEQQRQRPRCPPVEPGHVPPQVHRARVLLELLPRRERRHRALAGGLVAEKVLPSEVVDQGAGVAQVKVLARLREADVAVEVVRAHVGVEVVGREEAAGLRRDLRRSAAASSAAAALPAPAAGGGIRGSSGSRTLFSSAPSPRSSGSGAGSGSGSGLDPAELARRVLLVQVRSQRCSVPEDGEAAGELPPPLEAHRAEGRGLLAPSSPSRSSRSSRSSCSPPLLAAVFCSHVGQQGLVGGEQARRLPVRRRAAGAGPASEGSQGRREQGGGAERGPLGQGRRGREAADDGEGCCCGGGGGGGGGGGKRSSSGGGGGSRGGRGGGARSSAATTASGGGGGIASSVVDKDPAGPPGPGKELREALRPGTPVRDRGRGSGRSRRRRRRRSRSRGGGGRGACAAVARRSSSAATPSLLRSLPPPRHHHLGQLRLAQRAPDVPVAHPQPQRAQRADLPVVAAAQRDGLERVGADRAGRGPLARPRCPPRSAASARLFSAAVVGFVRGRRDGSDSARRRRRRRRTTRRRAPWSSAPASASPASSALGGGEARRRAVVVGRAARSLLLLLSLLSLLLPRLRCPARLLLLLRRRRRPPRGGRSRFGRRSGDRRARLCPGGERPRRR